MNNQYNKDLEEAIRKQDIQMALSSLTAPPFTANTTNMLIDLLYITANNLGANYSTPGVNTLIAFIDNELAASPTFDAIDYDRYYAAICVIEGTTLESAIKQKDILRAASLLTYRKLDEQQVKFALDHIIPTPKQATLLYHYNRYISTLTTRAEQYSN